MPVIVIDRNDSIGFTDEKELEDAYDAYRAEMLSYGQPPLSYEEWLSRIL